MAAPERDRAVIEAEAVRWFGHLRLGLASPGQARFFDQWLQADPAHRAAFERAESLWSDLGNLDEIPAARIMLEDAAALARAPLPALTASSRVRIPGHRWAFTAVAFAATLLVALVFFWPQLNPANSYATHVAEVRDVTLPDGSHAILGAQSRLKLAFTTTERRASLSGGEAFFEVKKDAQRPFTVEAGDTWIRVLGTRFNVHRGAKQVRVAVLDGVVEVHDTPPSAGNSQGRILLAGQQLTTRKKVSDSPAPTANGGERPDGWRQGRLSYDGAPLAEVVEDVNRYYPAGVALSTPQLADLKVTTAFQVDQIDLMLRSLAVALPVSVVRHGEHIVLVPRAGSP